MINKKIIILELKDNNWFGISHKCNHIFKYFKFKITKTGEDHFLYITVKAFKTKLKLFVNQIGCSHFGHFKNCQQLENNLNKLLNLTNHFFVKMLQVLQNNFSTQFVDIKLHEK